MSTEDQLDDDRDAVWQARFDALNAWQARCDTAAREGGRVVLRVFCGRCGRSGRPPIATVVGHPELGLLLVAAQRHRETYEGARLLPPAEVKSMFGVRVAPPVSGWALDLPTEVVAALPPGHPVPPELACPVHGTFTPDTDRIRTATGRRERALTLP